MSSSKIKIIGQVIERVLIPSAYRLVFGQSEDSLAHAPSSSSVRDNQKVRLSVLRKDAKMLKKKVRKKL